MSVQLSADFQNTDIMIKSKKTYCQVIFHISKHVYIYCILHTCLLNIDMKFETCQQTYQLYR